METPRLRTGDGKCKMQNLQCKRQNEVAGIRAGRLRWLVPCLVVGLMPLMAGAWSPVARAGVLELGEISRPRFASGDVDGDGQAELIVGGRVGPFRAVTDPPTSGRARVEVYRREGRLFQPMGAGFELSQVADVASGDLDGDGRWEVVAVGGGRMVILGWQAGSLAIRHVESLGNEWSDRVAAGDVDGDGRHELAVTLYGIGDEAELGQSSVVLYRMETGDLRGHLQFELPMHVGDLAFAGTHVREGMGLVLEVGAGDEGGEGLVYRYAGGRFEKTWGGPVTRAGTRSLTLSALGDLVAFGSGGDAVAVYQLDRGGLWFRGSLGTTMGGALVLVKGPNGETEIVAGAGGAGLRGSPPRATPLSF